MTIYGQREGTGTLIADASDVDSHAGIGGNESEKQDERRGGKVTINGGTVIAKGGSSAAGIGGGYRGESNDVTINGGTVYATGRTAGLGCGMYGDPSKEFGTCHINNGSVTAIASLPKIAIDFPGDKYGTYKVIIAKHLLTYAGGSAESAVRIKSAIGGNSPYYRIGKSTAYTVNHWRQKESGTDVYELYETETKTDRLADLPTDAKSKNYPGFTTKRYNQQTIAKDGSTVIDIHYSRNRYTIDFDANGHGEAPPSITAYYEQPIVEPARPKADGDYVFDGWFEEQECTTPFTFTTMPLNGKTLYARWIYAPVKFYTITWRMDNGEIIDTTKVREGEMPLHKAAIKSGHLFAGWNPFVVPATADTSYTAMFVEVPPDKLSVAFDTAGGSFIPPQFITKGQTVSKPADPVKDGYLFGGWYTDTGYGTLFDFGRTITKDTVIYARWTKAPGKKYEIRWMLNDITLIDTTEVTEGEMPVHGNPAIEGKIFIGWQPALAPVTGIAKYTAYFEERGTDKVAVTFNTGGGSFVETQVVTKGQKVQKPADPIKSGYSFVNWYADAAFAALYDFNTAVTADITLYAKWQKNAGREYTITFKDWDGKTLAAVKVEEGGLPVYPLSSKPSRSGYIFTGWNKDITLATADTTYTATYEPKSSGGGGGGGSSTPAAKKAAVTFSPNWYADNFGVWRIKNSAGQVVTNAWLCDDAVAANGQNVWYLLTQDGAMLAAGLVQDATGSFYSLETNHDGYFGMLRYTDGYYNCNGQQVYLQFSQKHDGTFGAVINADGIEKLKAIYGVTQYGIGNENSVYTAAF